MIVQNLKILFNAKFSRDEKIVMFFASLGGFLEFYDFAVFCFYATYFAQKIFPVARISSMFDVFIILAIGYSMKPIGILIYQKVGYKHSLKTLLNTSVLLIGICFLVIACLPEYRQAGAYVGVILLISRVIQGLAYGVEVQSMIKYVSANLGEHNRKCAVNVILLGMELGLLFGICLNKLLVICLSDIDLLIWGWRIPFFIGAVLSILCFIVRGRSNQFKIKQRNYLYKINIFSMFYRYRISILAYSGTVGILATLLVNGIIFMPVYLHHILNLDYTQIGNMLFNATLFAIVASVIVGYIAKIINPVLLLKLSFGSVIIASVISYTMFGIGVHINIGVYILVIYYGIFSALIPKVISFDFFPSYLKLTNTLIVMNIGFMLFGVMNPLITIFIVTFSHSMPIALCSFMIVMAILGLVSLQVLINMTNHIKHAG